MIISLLIVATAFVCIAYIKKPITDNNNYTRNQLASVVQSEAVIAHALGGINKIKYTNSLEALRKNFLDGKKIFEVDLQLTADLKAVPFHDFDAANKLNIKKPISDITEQEFLNATIDGKYTPINTKRLLLFLEAYTDTYLLVDAKGFGPDTFVRFLQEIEQFDPALTERIIPQVHSELELQLLNKHYYFPNVIYSPNKYQQSEQQVLKTVKNNPQMFAVAIPKKSFNTSFTKKLSKAGILTLVYTVNKEEEMKLLLQQGAHAIYSDFL